MAWVLVMLGLQVAKMKEAGSGSKTQLMFKLDMEGYAVKLSKARSALSRMLASAHC